MKKLLLIALPLLFTLTSFSQIDLSKYRLYTLIDYKGQSKQFYGKKLDYKELDNGFKAYDSQGKKLKEKITPMLYQYISYTNDEGIDMKLKAIKTNVWQMNFRYKKSFMKILIDKTQQEINSGKLGFYIHEYVATNGQGSLKTYNLYYEDVKGAFRADQKRFFKKYTKVLGLKLYDAMKASKKDEITFLTDYFNERNK